LYGNALSLIEISLATILCKAFGSREDEVLVIAQALDLLYFALAEVGLGDASLCTGYPKTSVRRRAISNGGETYVDRDSHSDGIKV
jgi:hypothetical protein